MSEMVVFAGRGSSHSWTWFADFLEGMGAYDTRFLDTREFVESLDEGAEVAVLSGGDGHAIADSLKGPGFARLKHFVEFGGRYVGVCAGAYLPLPSRIPPFSEFNLSTTKICNIDHSAGAGEEIPRRSVAYGSCSIVHPIRGDVELSYEGRTVRAPLFGGPVFADPEKDRVLLRYVGFGPGTEFQTGKDVAQATVLGKPAALLSQFGGGTLLLLGPHLEHPRYPEANRLLGNFMGIVPMERRGPRVNRAAPPALARSLADIKVAATGLEGRSFLVGKKLWDSSRFLELVSAIEKRAWRLEPGPAEQTRVCLDKVREMLLATKVGADSDVDEATMLMISCARECVDSYFRSMVEYA